MAGVAAPSRLSARERARRAARGGAARSVPVPLLVPALIAVAFLALPLIGLLVRAPWGHAVPEVLRIEVSGKVGSGHFTVRPPHRTFWQWLSRKPPSYPAPSPR